MVPVVLLTRVVVICVVFFSLPHFSYCQWNFSPEETEVFDLVDETKTNFYDSLNVSQDASQQEIRRSYRQLSRTMHPDKNKTEGAEESFRILVAMYEVLKNKEKREIYDNVLVNGLPASYLYVPRQLRKMSLLEVSIIISLIITVGHFLVMWGSYFEKRLAMDTEMSRIQKRLKKQKKRGGMDDDGSQQEIEEFLQSSKPTVYDVLPILMGRKFFAFAFWFPHYIKETRELRRQQKEEEEAKQKEEEKAEQRRLQEIARREESKRQKKEYNRIKREEMQLAEKLTAEGGPLPPSVFDNSEAIDELEAMYDEMTDEDFTRKKSKKDKWNEDDSSMLARLMTKYPGGTPERWVRISRVMGRPVNEIIAKAKAVRSDVGTKGKYSAVTQPVGKLTQNKRADKHSIPDEIISTAYEDEDDGNSLLQRLQEDSDSGEISKLKKKQEARDIKMSLKQTKTTNEIENEDKWEQNQQKLLEMALQQFPRSSSERWDKIAKCVPGKTKEECMARYRFLAEKIQQRRKQRS